MTDKLWPVMMGLEAVALLFIVIAALARGGGPKRAPMRLTAGEGAKLVLGGIAILALAVYLLTALAKGQ